MSTNPANLSYDNRVPYITVTEFQNSPIASSIDFSNLVPSGTQAQQDDALAQLILMASAEADNIVLGPMGTMCATLNTEQGRYRQNRQGFYVIHPAYWPILEVDSVSIGSVPSGQVAIPVSSSTVWIEDRQFTVLSGAFNWTSAGPLSFGAAGGSYGSKPDFITYTYVNGFFNAFSTASVSAGSTSITVGSTIGAYVGQTVQIWDGLNTESLKIATVSGQTLTFTTGFVYNHQYGTNVSVLPASIKQAVIHLVVAGIKQRGEGGLVIAETGGPTAVGGGMTGSSDLMRARELLHAFLQVWGRS